MAALLVAARVSQRGTEGTGEWREEDYSSRFLGPFGGDGQGGGGGGLRAYYQRTSRMA